MTGMGIPFDLLNVPEDNGGVLAIPPIAEYPALIGRNRGLNRTLTIGGTPLERLRPIARKAALETAMKYTLSLGLDPGPAPDPDGPIIASGHQPILFHPGIMIKPMILANAARAAKAAALFITVDSDEFRAENAPIPVIAEGRIKRLDYPLFPMRAARLYETAEAEPAPDFVSRLEAMGSFMEDKRLARPREAMAAYVARLKKTPLDFPDYVSRSIVMRRAWLAPDTPGFLEAPVSILSQGAPFLAFAAGIMVDIERFAEAYNGALDAFRRVRKLRYPANPFPNLEKKGDLIQAPFWAIHKGARMKLYVRAGAGADPALTLENGTEAPMATLMEGKLHIRPKAITLSLYMRLVLCDLFIHGVGGAKYDHVTDDIITRYWGGREPEPALLSATRWLDVPAEDPRPRMAEIERALRDMEFHPEKAVAGLAGMGPLASEKARLVEAIKAPGADKKSMGARIGELNQSMAAPLKEPRASSQTELDGLLPLEREREAAQARDYPYFLYSKERLIALAGKAT